MRGWRAARRWGGLALGWLLLMGWGAASEGYAQPTPEERPPVDIVFLMDESGSMFNDRDEVRARIVDVVTALSDRVDLRLGLVGFGAYAGHAGTTADGEPHLHLPLTDSVELFAQALGELVSNGLREPGLSAVTLGMSGAMGFRSNASVCAVLISDEDADVYPEAPASPGEALAALRQRDAVFFAVVDPAFEFTASVYGPAPGSLADRTGGQVFRLLSFRANPDAVLRALFTGCVRAAADLPRPAEPAAEAEAEAEPPSPAPWEELQAQIERLGPTITWLVEAVEEQTARLNRLEGQKDRLVERNSQVETELRSLQATVAQLESQWKTLAAAVESRLQAVEVSLEETRTSVAERLKVLEDVDWATLTSSVARLTEEHRGMVSRLEALRDRTSALEATVLDLSGDVGQRFESLLDRLGAVQEEGAAVRARVAQLEKAVQEIPARLRDDLASLRATVDSLNESDGQLQGQLSDLEARLEALAERVEALPEEIARPLRAQIEDLQAALAEVERLQAEGGERTDRLQDRANALEQDLLSVRSLVVRLGEDQRDLRDWLRELAERVAELEKQEEILAALRQARERHARQLEELTARGNALSDRVAALKGEVEANRKALQGVEGVAGELAALAAALEELRGELARFEEELRGELAALAPRVRANEDGQQDLQQTMEALRNKLQSLLARWQEQIPALEGQVQGLAAELAELGKTLELLEEVPALQREIEALQQEVAPLRELPDRLDELAQTLAQDRDRWASVQARLAELSARQERLAQEVAELRRAVADLGPTLLRTMREGLREEIRREVQASVPRIPERIEQEGLQPELILRLAVAAFAFSLAAVALAILL